MRSVSGCCSLPSTPTPSLLLSRVPPHTRPLSVVYIPLSFSISFNEHHPPSLTALPFPCSPPAIYPPLRPLPVFLSFRDTFSRSLARSPPFSSCRGCLPALYVQLPCPLNLLVVAQDYFSGGTPACAHRRTVLSNSSRDLEWISTARSCSWMLRLVANRWPAGRASVTSDNQDGRVAALLPPSFPRAATAPKQQAIIC